MFTRCYKLEAKTFYNQELGSPSVSNNGTAHQKIVQRLWSPLLLDTFNPTGVLQLFGLTSKIALIGFSM